MNWRKSVLWGLLRLSGSQVPDRYARILDLAEGANSIAQCQASQHEQLARLLQHACKNVPYYQKIFSLDELVSPDGRVDIDAFQRLPLLGKVEMRRDFAALQSVDTANRHRFENSSGGSTGEPVRFIQDNAYRDGDIAATLFLFHQAGKEIGEAELKLWGSERDIELGSLGWRQSIENWLYNRTLVNSFRLTEAGMFNLVSRWNAKCPVVVWTYVDSIFEFARFIEQKKIKLTPPKVIITTAGTLDQTVKDFLEKIFQTRVLNQYGSREVGVLACEEPGGGALKSGGLRLFEWKHYVEIVDDDGAPCLAGQEGNIIVTCLENYSMPLIRFAIGDRGVMIEDGGQTRLAKVTGRITDHFVSQDGSLIHGEYFTHLFYFKPWVRRFQVVQKSYHEVICFVVPESEPPSSDLAMIKGKIQHVMGQECQVHFEMVDTIEPSKSGKYLYTRCDVKRD